MILGLRTDKPEAELYLCDNNEVLDSYVWRAHRELSDTLLIKIEELLNKHKISLSQITGLIVYQGPGSFTGLRIGIATANTLSYSLNVPVAASTGDDWLEAALKTLALSKQKKAKTILPKYGAKPNITAPKK